MFGKVSKYEVPFRFLIQVGDEEPDVLAQKGLPYPYNVQTAIPRMLREIADELEEMANGSTSTASRRLRAD